MSSDLLSAIIPPVLSPKASMPSLKFQEVNCRPLKLCRCSDDRRGSILCVVDFLRDAKDLQERYPGCTVTSDYPRYVEIEFPCFSEPYIDKPLVVLHTKSSSEPKSKRS